MISPSPSFKDFRFKRPIIREENVRATSTRSASVVFLVVLKIFKVYGMWCHSERSPKGGVKNLIEEEILRAAINLPQDDSNGILQQHISIKRKKYFYREEFRSL